MENDALARVAAYLQTTNKDRTRIGPFAAGFTSHNSNPMLNYAVPVTGADPTPQDIAALIDTYTGRGLLPRLEYLPTTAPLVEPALLAAGFTVERRPAVMVCRAGQVNGVPEPDVALELATDRDAYAEVIAVQHIAYGEPAPPTGHDIDRMARFVDGGGLVGLARAGGTVDGGTVDGGTVDGGTVDGGTVVGGGQLTAITGGVGELVGIAVADSHRGRGIATALSAYLTRLGHGAGADLVWLEPEGEAVARMYGRVGYQVVGAKLYLSR
jgi:GNAT superfamily N-acetyltransferase